MFYASDVPVQVRTLLEEALTAAANEWGNYGPLEYWVAGIDVTAAEELADQYCTRRDDRGEMDKSECLQYQHTAKFLPEMAAAATEAIETGNLSSGAGRNGARWWGFHLFASSYPFGFAGLLDISFADDQTVAFHEYFHAVQTAHIFTHDRDDRDEMMGPMWFIEGGAEFMAQTTSQRLRDSGTLTASTWDSLATRMEWKMNSVKEYIAANPGVSGSDIGYGPDQNIGYDYGTWAHAYLANLLGPDALLDSFYANLNDLGWEASFANTYGMSSTAFLAVFDEFVGLPIEEQLSILPTTTTTTTTTVAPTTTQVPTTTTTTTLPPETVKEYLQRIGMNVPKLDPQHWYLFSETIPEDFIAQHAEIHGLLIEVLGGYDRFVHIVYNLDDPNEANIATLNELGLLNGQVTSIDQVHELRSCLSGFTAFENWDGRHHYSFCVNPNPLVATPGEPEWAENDRRNNGPVNYRYGLFHGWVHEYFHHYQRAHEFDRAMAMPDDCCGLNDPVGAPAWWVEGAAIAFPNLFMKEYFDRLSWSREHGLTLEDATDTQLGSILQLRWEEILRSARREIVHGEDGECRGVGIDEEYRHTAKCSYRHWFLMNVYLAYLTSWQTLWVDLLEDMWALDFDGSFEKHVGMTVDEFYDSYNAFMSEGDPDDPPPPGFFPTEPLSELVDFWGIQSG